MASARNRSARTPALSGRFGALGEMQEPSSFIPSSPRPRFWTSSRQSGGTRSIPRSPVSI